MYRRRRVDVWLLLLGSAVLGVSMVAASGDQVPAWEEATFRSLSGLLAKDVSPGRDDALYGVPQEQATTRQHPVESSRPPQAEQP